MNATNIGVIFRNLVDENDVLPPDSFDPSLGLPSSEFVLCRDLNGKATAIYGEEIWNFKPYVLNGSRNKTFKFPKDSRFSSELKHLMFVLIYFANAGRYGKLTVSTLAHYWRGLRAAAKYCESLDENELVGQINLKQLFTNETYLTGFAHSYPSDSSLIVQICPAVLNHLGSIGENIVGYAPINGWFLSKNRKETKQHPIIPARIYVNLVNQFDFYIDTFMPFGKQLEDFISCFSDKYYGRGHKLQQKEGVGMAKLRPTFSEAISDHGLGELFSQNISATDKKLFFSALRKIQYVIKCIIHCYTGMRDAEALRLPYECLSTKSVVEATYDDHGLVRDSGKMVNLISTTTKLEGYPKVVSWLAPEVVKNAISLGQCIARGLATVYGVSYADSPLFIHPSCHKTVNINPIEFTNDYNELLFDNTINAEDLALLRASDPTRKFNHKKFEVGQEWPLTSHQFRRSLAFYATSSGLVSLPTLKKQFKHLSLEMARYYSNHFENIKSVFGYYDSERGEFILPGNHSAFEYQLAVPMSTVDQIMKDVLGDGHTTFGSTGSQAEKLRKRAQTGEISIEDIRVKTETSVRNGEISYRETLLGGCMYLGKCNSFMLGNYTECLGCSGAVIHLKNIESAIENLKHELSCYEEGTGEHDLTNLEMDIFIKYRGAILQREKKRGASE